MFGGMELTIVAQQTSVTMAMEMLRIAANTIGGVTTSVIANANSAVKIFPQTKPLPNVRLVCIKAHKLAVCRKVP